MYRIIKTPFDHAPVAPTVKRALIVRTMADTHIVAALFDAERDLLVELLDDGCPDWETQPPEDTYEKSWLENWEVTVVAALHNKAFRVSYRGCAVWLAKDFVPNDEAMNSPNMEVRIAEKKRLDAAIWVRQEEVMNFNEQRSSHVA